MTRKKGAEQIDMARFKNIYDLREGGMRVGWIANVLEMNYRTIYSITQHKNYVSRRNHVYEMKNCAHGCFIGFVGISTTILPSI